jgi:hypothetical protein
MKSFRTIFARDLDSVSLKSEMETYGYVFIRDLMPKGDLEQLLSDMIGIASDEGWTIEGAAPSDRIANPTMACFDPEPKYKQAANRVPPGAAPRVDASSGIDRCDEATCGAAPFGSSQAHCTDDFPQL